MTTVSARTGMPLDECLELASQQPFELINGEKKPKAASMFGHGRTIRAAFLALHSYTRSVGSGEVFSEMTVVLPDGEDENRVSGSRIPDVMFYMGDRIRRYSAEQPNYENRLLASVPDLVIEVVSPNDRVSELDEKIDLYLADGVRLIWIIDPQRRKAVIYAPDAEQPSHLAGDALLDGGEVLPGLQLKLSSLLV